MTVPKTIEKHAREYVETKSQKAYQKVVDWLNNYTDADLIEDKKYDKRFE